jgi:fibronectin-binding autotransporter adhesin
VNFINHRVHGTIATTGRLQRRLRARGIVLCAIAPIAAALAPTAGAAVQLSGVASGTASVSQNGSVTTIKTSNNAILNFSAFNIAHGSTVDFLQPSAASRVLDQINSASPSQINGSLISNGTVYLINPAGVIFGAGAMINVNNFYVAGSHMANQDFLDNVNHFTGVSGLVSNSGQIHANQVYMVGSQVINQGSIVSPNGVVAMLSGSDVIVTEPGSHVTATVVPVVSATTAAGTSKTPDLRISTLAAGDAYSLAIRHTGSIQASTVLINGGGGQVQVSGSINASSQTPGATGGNVSITGGEVDLISAIINASGPAGGGDVLIGGGPHGTGDLTHATLVSLDSGTTINADATSNGPGGSIVLWSTSDTSSSAVLTARGGPLGGDGGYAETSGDILQVTNAPIVSATDGKPGTWDLDPLSITIISGADMGTSTFTGSSTITNGTIETALTAGDNVLITTNQTGAGTGTLTQDSDAPIAVSLSGSTVLLQLQSNSDMTLMGGISNTGGSTLNVELDQLNGTGNAIAINTNPININGTLAIIGGNVALSSGGTLSAPSITIGSAIPTGGTTTLATGSVTLGSSVTSTSGGITIGPSLVDNVDAAVVTANGQAFSATGSSFTSNSSGTIATGGGAVTLTMTGGITIGGTVNTGSGAAGGSFTATGTGFTTNAAISDGGAATGAGTLSINTSTGTGAISINGSVDWTGGAGRSATIEGGGPITVTSAGNIDAAGGSSLPIALYTTGSGSAVTISGTINTGGTFTSDGGNFSVTSPGTPTTIITAQSIAINTANTTPDSKTVTLGSATISGPVTATGGVFSAGGTTSFTTNTTGTITTDDTDVIISNSGAITVDAPVITAGAPFSQTGGSSFTSSSAGTITTSDGTVTIQDSGAIVVDGAINTGGGGFSQTGGNSFTSSSTGTLTTAGGNITIQDFGGITTGGTVNTGGGAFTVTGTAFENDAAISDGGTGTGTNALSVNVSSGNGAIDINGTVDWTGGSGRSITFEGGGNITITTNGGIDQTGSTPLPVSLYTTDAGSAVTLTGSVDTLGAFISSGGNFTITAPTATTPPTPEPVIVTAVSISINTATITPDSKSIGLGSVTISGPVVSTGGVFNAGGAGSFTNNEFGTITTSAANGNVDITNTGADTLNQAVSTGSGSFTATLGTSFTTATSGTITTTDGAVTINVSGAVSLGNNITTGGGNFSATGSSFADSTPLTTSGGNVTLTTTGGGITVSNTINTGGGSFTAIGASFTETGTITDGGVTSGSPSFSVNTSSGTAAITVSEPITFPTVTLEGGGNVVIATNGAIDATGAVSLYTIGAGSGITITGTVTAGGAFIADGGNVTITAPAATTPPTPEPIIVTAQSININTATLTPDGKTITLSSVSIGGPILANGVAANGPVDIGGTVSLTTNQFGTITTTGGPVNITNNGTIDIGEPVVTAGGNFTSTAGTGFSTSTAGSITTSGGSVLLAASTSSEINIGNLINTGGASFTATAMGMTITATITDGGVNTGSNSFSINTTSGTDPITISGAGDISWSGGTGRSVTVEGGGSISFSKLTATGTTPLPVSLYSTSTVTTDSITLNSNVIGNGPFIASGQGFTLSSGATLSGTTININTLTTTPDSKTLTPGAVVISGSMDATGTLTVDGTSVDMSSGGITTNGGALTIVSTGVVTIEGPVLSDGGAINMSSGASFTSDSNGTITSDGGDISIQGVTGVTISAAVTTGGGNFSAAGSTFTSNAEISDGGVNDSKAQGLSITASAGNATIDGAISWASSLSPITITVPTGHTLSLGASITANSLEPINFSNTAVLISGSSTSLTGGNITLGNVTDDLSEGDSFAIKSAGNVVVGAVTDTSSGGDSISVAGVNVTLGALTNQVEGGTEIEVLSSGDVSLQAIGTSAVPFGQIIVTNNGTAVTPTTTLHGNIFLSGNVGTPENPNTSGIDFAGTVILPNNIQISEVDPTPEDTAIVEFDGTVEGPGGLTVFLPGPNFGQIRFNNNVGDVTPLRFLNLFPGGSADTGGGIVAFRWGVNFSPPPDTEPQPLTTVNIASGGDFEINDVTPTVRLFTSLFATIDSYGPLSINIGSASSPSAANTYAVGQNEKLTIYGDLTLDTNGGTITTGDISTFGNMTLDASAIKFRLRGSTVANGVIVDSGMDLIAGGKMSLPSGATFSTISGDPVPGSFDVPGFIAQSYSSNVDIGTIANNLKTAFSFVFGLSPSVLFGPAPSGSAAGNLLLDLTPNTLTTSIPTFVPPTPFVFDYGIAGAAPWYELVAGTVPLDFKIAYPPAVPGPIVQEQLKDAGLYTQDPTLDEILGAVDTMAVYDDMPQSPRPRPADYKVVVNRLDSRRLDAFMDEYNQVFGQNPEARRTEMALEIQRAWDAYVSQNGDQPVSGPGFAQYCGSTPSAAGAGADLQQLHGLRIQLGGLGLSFKEAQVAFRYNVLTGLSAIGMREGDLAWAAVSAPVKH